MELNEEKIKSVVSGFFEKLHADDLMSNFLKDLDQERFQHHPQTFLEHGFGQQRYENQEVAKAHQGLQITNEHFNSMLGYFMESLNDQGLTEEDHKRVEEILNSYKKEVLGN